ncbi:ATP synthase subunit a [Reticulibacter mediterranei]|uniref:ATP synthase subunit a n=1 Tax=Reticulibacter mediterranei TaxID=2778369 RepID=A0A8J3IHD2_9CHLR|nr:F0F1 ATP synthase subunit A [Reticulibacter mediterranei]GHO92435.1 ATP synthase subunit a [Reticulibacter mediterranei]
MNLWKLPNIQLTPEVIFTIPGTDFHVTNTLFCTWITLIVLFLAFFFATRRKDMIPRGWQNFMEWIVELLRGLVQSVSGKENGKKFFPLVASFFFFILVSNLLDVIPGVDSIGSIEPDKLPAGAQPGILLWGDASNALVSWVRPPTTDLNLTIAMALVAVITAQFYGFFTLGFRGHVGKYVNLRSLFKFSFEGAIEFFVGLLEIIQEISRVISLAFRLFGNIFAGSVVLAIFAFLLPAVANIVFIPFELFVAGVQAFVFSLLTLIYLQLAVTGHGDHEEGHGQEEEASGAHQAAAH